MSAELPARPTSPGDGASDAAARKVRVLLVGPSLDILGGQAVQLQRLLKNFRTSHVIEPAFLPVNPRLPGIFARLQRAKYVRTVATSVAYVWSLLRNVGKHDVVHAFSASYWSYVLAPLPAIVIGRLFGRKVVLNYRSGEAHDHLTRWRWLAVPTMRLADSIIVPSGYLVGVFAEFGLRATAIANFVDVEQIPFRRRERIAPVFLSNRNLEPLYNVECAIRAFGFIQKEVPDARLLVAGFGSEQTRLEALASELALRSVTFFGRLGPDRMSKLYGEADVYLNTPNIDNMPNSVIEAFAAGLPVLTTDAGGIPFVVTHERTGLIVRAGDSEALARAALRVLREPGLAASLAANARDECLARYVWSSVVGEWESLYVRLTRSSASVADSPSSRRGHDTRGNALN